MSKIQTSNPFKYINFIRFLGFPRIVTFKDLDFILIINEKMNLKIPEVCQGSYERGN